MSGISHQNYDIESKILGEYYKDKSFKVYGLDLPKIVEVLPTNLPRVAADEKRIDNLFRLEDGTVAIVDYESKHITANFVKYINYIARVMERYYNEEHKIIDLRMIVIYTGDVTNAESVLKTTCFSMTVEQAFLSNLPGDDIYSNIRNKIEAQEDLTDENLMQLIILPLTEVGKEKKKERLRQVIDLAKKVREEKKQVYIIAGVLVNSDKFIDDSYSEEIRRWLKMTKVFKLFEEEKQEAVNIAKKETTEEMAVKLIKLGLDNTEIMMVTGLTREDLDLLRKEIPEENTV